MYEVMLRSIAFYNNLLMETFISTRIHVCAFPEGPAKMMFSENRINGTSSSESDESALVCVVVVATCGGEGGGSSLSESTGFGAFFRVLGGMRQFVPFLKTGSQNSPSAVAAELVVLV